MTTAGYTYKVFMMDRVCVTGTGFIVDETVDALGRPLATSKKTMFGAKIHDRSDANLKTMTLAMRKTKKKRMTRYAPKKIQSGAKM